MDPKDLPSLGGCLLEAAPDPILVVDGRGRIVLCNGRTLEVFGYSRSELFEQPIEILVPERFRDAHVWQRARYEESPQARHMGTATTQLWGHRKDGTDFPLDVSLSPLRAPEGNFVIAIVRDVSHRVFVEQRLRHVSTHDALTGLYNRAFFDEELARLDRGRSRVGIVLVDLDALKVFNDRFGYESGDRLLQDAATALSQAFRAEDVVARLGGDEFGVLVPGIDESGLARTLAHLRDRSSPPAQDRSAPALHLSLGSAVGGHGELADTLLVAAEALRADKEARRSRNALHGDLRQVSLPSLLSFLEMEQKTGELVVVGPQTARLRLRAGRPLRVHIEGAAAATQEAMMFQLLDWLDGQFEFVSEDDATSADEIGTSLTSLLLEHARRADEAGSREA